MRNAYKILIGKPDGKKPLGRRRRRWEDNMKMKIAVFWVVAPCSTDGSEVLAAFIIWAMMEAAST
jgi:hypothetical protein